MGAGGDTDVVRTARQRPRRGRVRALAVTTLLVLLAAAWPPARCGAQDATQDPSILEREHFTGNWGGTRDEIEKAGFAPYLVYTGSMWSDVGGGLRTGTEFNGYLDFGVGVDFTKLGLWEGFGLQLSWHWFQGREPSLQLVGVDLTQAVNLWEASNAFRVFNLYFTQTFGTDGIVQLGQMAVDSDFMVSRYAGNFLNATFGDMPPQSLNLDSPEYPLAGPGVYATSSLVDGLTGRLGVYTADVGVDTSGNHGFGWQLGNNAGYAVFGELTLDASPDDLPGAWTLGGYWVSSRELELDGSGYVHSLWSGWVMVDQALRVDAEGDPVVGVFARASYTPDDGHNVIGVYADAGLNVFGPVPGRPKDILGFAGGVFRYTDDFRRNVEASGAIGIGGEAILEATYQIAATPWLSVQPDLQYVIDPVVAGNDATVIGLQMVATF